MPPIAAISFDADDTLWDFGSSMRAALAHSARRFTAEGLRGPQGEVSVDWLSRLREEVAARLPEATLDDIRRAAFAEALTRCGANPEGLAEQYFQEYVRERYFGLTLFPEVRAVLTELGSRLPLAVTTNGNTDPAVVGLGDTFACVTNPYESGFRKPDPRIFHLTAERLGVDPAAVLHVGDHLTEDAVGARDAGLQARWLNRRAHLMNGVRHPASVGIQEIPTLAELLTL